MIFLYKIQVFLVICSVQGESFGVSKYSTDEYRKANLGETEDFAIEKLRRENDNKKLNYFLNARKRERLKNSFDDIKSVHKRNYSAFFKIFNDFVNTNYSIVNKFNAKIVNNRNFSAFLTNPNYKFDKKFKNSRALFNMLINNSNHDKVKSKVYKKPKFKYIMYKDNVINNNLLLLKEGPALRTALPRSSPYISKNAQINKIFPEFLTKKIVKPQMYSRTKRSIAHTRNKKKNSHKEHIKVGIILNGKEVLIDLILNSNLFSGNYTEVLIKRDSEIIKRPTGVEVELCHYNGKIEGVRDSWAAVSTCNGIRGIIFDGREIHYLEPSSENQDINNKHFLLSHKDLSQNLTCGFKNHSPWSPAKIFEEGFGDIKKRSKREAGPSRNTTIRGPYNSNALSRYVELVLVADKTEFEKHGSDVNKMKQRLKDIANIVNALYQPLNIFVALVGVEIWHDEDLIEVSTDGDKALTNFLNYRKIRLIPNHPNDNAQLLTGKSFDSGVVGKALKGPICTYQYSGGVNMDHSDSVGLVATTVAHEMGHNFGMEHDTEEDCKCPDKRCIMAPSSGMRSPSHWSTCSHEYLAISFERSMDYCLRNKPTTLYDSPICGNGFVELGEQCDCGLKEYCDNPCCNPATCMLFSNATCATGLCCDLKTCHPKNAGFMCRKPQQECDLPEYCTGDSEFCPDNFYKENGSPCQNKKAYCFEGMCRTHEKQCKLLWGPTGKNSHDKCYKLNKEGNTHGNCGYNWVNNSYKRCNEDDVKCGTMHCKHFNERLEFGMESVSKVSHRFIADSEGVIPCRVAQVDLGLDMVDPGLAPDGSQCGFEKVCVDQKCLAVSSLKINSCECNNRGVCNNFGHCHCYQGFSPPDCLSAGPGGSVDSGPAIENRGPSSFVTGLLVFFLGVVPVCLLVMASLAYLRTNPLPWYIKKRTRLTQKETRVKTPHNGPIIFPTRKVDSRLRSDSPPSSDSSMTNSPLLKNVQSGLTGKFEGFSLTPIKEKKDGQSEIEIAGLAERGGLSKKIKSENLSIVGMGQSESKPLPKPNNIYVHWRNRTSTLPSDLNPQSKKNVNISGPSLQTSTNPSLKTHSGSSSRAPTPLDLKPERPLSVPEEASICENKNIPPSSSFDSKSNIKDVAKTSNAASRVVSFLSRKDKDNTDNRVDSGNSSTSTTGTLSRKASKIDRQSLMQLEISNPITVEATADLPSSLVPVRPAPNPPESKNIKPSEVKTNQANYIEESNQNLPKSDNKTRKISWGVTPTSKFAPTNSEEQFSRVGSVREPSITQKPVVHKFGSMRVPRPKSLPPARPSQPPPRPPLPAIPAVYEDSITVTFSPKNKVNISPIQESIYCTIDESPLNEVAPNISVRSQEQPENKEKKSIFSMLYAKTVKPKQKIITSDEPLYLNIDAEESQQIELSSNIEFPPDKDLSERESVIASDKVSCSSAEEGGLLSEIVGELAVREPQFVGALSKRKKGLKTDEKIETNTVSSSKLTKDSGHNSENFSNKLLNNFKTKIQKPAHISDNQNSKKDQNTSCQINLTSEKENSNFKSKEISSSKEVLESKDSCSAFRSSKPRGVFSFFSGKDEKNKKDKNVYKIEVKVKENEVDKQEVLKVENSYQNNSNNKSFDQQPDSNNQNTYANVSNSPVSKTWNSNPKLDKTKITSTPSSNSKLTLKNANDLTSTSSLATTTDSKKSPNSSYLTTNTEFDSKKSLNSTLAGVKALNSQIKSSAKPQINEKINTFKAKEIKPVFPPDKVLSPTYVATKTVINEGKEDNNKKERTEENGDKNVTDKNQSANLGKSGTPKIPAIKDLNKPVSTSNTPQTKPMIENKNKPKIPPPIAKSKPEMKKDALNSNSKPKFSRNQLTASNKRFGLTPTPGLARLAGVNASVDAQKVNQATETERNESKFVSPANSDKPVLSNVQSIPKSSTSTESIQSKIKSSASNQPKTKSASPQQKIRQSNDSKYKRPAPAASKSTSNVASLQEKFEKHSVFEKKN